MLLSGKLKRKMNFPGIWKKYNAELYHSQLVLTTKKEKDKLMIPITKDTKVEYVTKKKKPSIVIENNEDKICLRTQSTSDLMTWLMELRSETFFNKNLSMEKFDIIRVLGRGFFGKVMLVKHKESGEISAIKTIHKKTMIETQKVHTILSERSILGKMHHPFITELKFAFQSSTKFYIGLEYVPGGELQGVISRNERIPERDVMIYIAEIAMALSELHMKGIVYRDLKPENVLIGADGHIKLADFGLSKDISRVGLTKTFCGTLDFMSPEIVQQRAYGKEVDWWALGVLSYALLYKKLPFSDPNRQKEMEMILNSEPSFEGETHPLIVDLVKLLLNKDLKKRAKWDIVQKHPVWAEMGLNLDDILAKKIHPEFIPDVSDQENTQYFDKEFTMEPAIDSVASVPIENNRFPGFTYLKGYEDSD